MKERKEIKRKNSTKEKRKENQVERKRRGMGAVSLIFFSLMGSSFPPSSPFCVFFFILKFLLFNPFSRNGRRGTKMYSISVKELMEISNFEGGGIPV